MRRDEEQIWQMAVVGSLAGGQGSKQAVESADKVREAYKSRFPDPEHDDD